MGLNSEWSAERRVIPSLIEVDSGDSQKPTNLNRWRRTKELELSDYAVLMILAKLGLRASEAAALNVDDIEAVTHDRLDGKGRRQAMTPLRPRRRNSNRRLYPAWTASFSVPSAISADACGARGFRSGCAITMMAKQALDLAVSDGAHHGAHLFSHSLAQDVAGRSPMTPLTEVPRDAMWPGVTICTITLPSRAAAREPPS